MFDIERQPKMTLLRSGYSNTAGGTQKQIIALSFTINIMTQEASAALTTGVRLVLSDNHKELYGPLGCL